MMTRVVTTVFWLSGLYAAFVIKHLLADFIFQSEWMVRGKEQERGWLLPLGAHAACHAMLTLGLALLILPAFWWLSLVDFVVHGGIDRLKAIAMRRMRLAETSRKWWRLFGIDQALHQLTHFSFIIVFLVA
jgi:Protein of unknown function (DUF3307)